MLLKKALSLVVLTALLLTAIPTTVAQNTISLTLSVPTLWEDALTPELLAEFEAQYPGVQIHVVFSQTNFFAFGGGGTEDITTSLESTGEFVSTADVLYIDSSDLTVTSTLADYYLDLAPLVNSDPTLDIADFIPAVWQSYQWDQGIWALPLSTDAVILTYDPVAFDMAGLAYPNERWTIDDFAYAARQLTAYNNDGSVAVPGFSTNSGGNNTALFLRSLLSAPLFDSNFIPNPPTFADPQLSYILDIWVELLNEGVVTTTAIGGSNRDEIPLRVEGVNGYSVRFNDADERQAVLLPGGTAGLNTQGFAVSSGTLYPEIAYALAKFLTTLPELANNQFSVAPARQSLSGTSATQQQGGLGGGQRFGSIPASIQPVIDQALMVGMPISEIRYADYLNSAISEMQTSGLDGLSALQKVEAQAIEDMQTANNHEAIVTIIPPTNIVVESGQIALNVGLNTGLGGRLRGQLSNQNEWDQLNADFVAVDPQVGYVNLETTNETDLAVLADTYDCFILPSNAVQGANVSMLLNLDPLLDTDFNFDRNDIVGNTLTQLQQDNKVWALPLAMQPQMLQFDPEAFAQAGVPAPVGGWTIDQFTDALRMLKLSPDDPAPFLPNDPSGSYMMMLIAAFGGLPIDYRTDPPTLNFTNPASMNAIQQALDLAVDGYIEYSPLSVSTAGGFASGISDTEYAITTDTLSRFNVRGSGLISQRDVPLLTITYPQGNTFGAIAYETITGYISATAENPEACYAYLSTVAQNPQLFDGMPARRSLISDPGVIASQGVDIVEVYNQLDLLMQDSNTIIFPTFTTGRGAVTTLATEYWLKQAFDNYVLYGTDLEIELMEAEQITVAYLECTAQIPTPDDAEFSLFLEMQQCATSVDPNFTLGN